jgi:PadR family transcriptional regulator AphA
MAREQASRYMLLGLLDWRPMSGYDIKKIVEKSIKDFWHESYGNIYPILQGFVKEGLAERRVERQEGRPDRIEYTITPAGRAELVAWLERPTGARRVRDVFLAKFIFGHLLSKEQNIEQVEAYCREREERLEWYRETLASLEENAWGSRKLLFEFLALRQGFVMTEARLKWCDEVLYALRNFKGD